jgi:2-amino-4-hydroxy-6-hydroxymethyldihydropteridine diphosphokinase
MGNREAHLALARARLAELPDTRLLATSDVEETAAITANGEAQDHYLNQMVLIETDLSPSALLKALHAIEQESGRESPERRKRWAPRTLDLDIVLLGDGALEVHSTELTVPHPQLPNRPFWQRGIEQIRAKT